jgi:hypothetical protein
MQMQEKNALKPSHFRLGEGGRDARHPCARTRPPAATTMRVAMLACAIIAAITAIAVAALAAGATAAAHNNNTPAAPLPRPPLLRPPPPGMSGLASATRGDGYYMVHSLW